MSEQSRKLDTANKDNEILRKEVENLKKQLHAKEKLLSEMEQVQTASKEIENELIELYRVLHYYEGKVKYLEGTALVYEDQYRIVPHDSPTKIHINAKEIIAQFRSDNSDLHGRLERASYDAKKLNGRVSELETRAQNQLKPSLKQSNIGFNRDSSVNKLGASNALRSSKISGSSSKMLANRKQAQLKLKTAESLDEYYQVEQKPVLNEMNLRMAKLEKDIEQIRKNNEKLSKELDEALKENHQLKIQAMPTSSSNPPRKESKANSYRVIDDDEELQLRAPNPIKPEDNANTPIKAFDDLSRIRGVVNKSPKPEIPKTKSQAQFPKNTVAQILKPHNSVKQLPAANKAPLVEQAKKQALRKQICQKIAFHCMREEIPHPDLIQKLVGAICEPNTPLITLMQDMPYILTISEAIEFDDWSSKLKAEQKTDTKQFREYARTVLRNCVLGYRVIQIRSQFAFSKQIGQKFRNYEEEIGQLISQCPEGMPYEEAKKYFVGNWAVTPDEFNYICLKSYEESRQTATVDIKKLNAYFQTC